MQKVYFDNSSTSLPKAPAVSCAMKKFIDFAGYNLGRGDYTGGFDTAMEVLATRELIASFFNASSPREVIFTPGLSYALNMVLLGFLSKGDHVITTSMEHNSVMRPLHALSECGVSYSIAKCDNQGRLNPCDVEKLITPNTKAIVMTHASNVCGTVLPIAEVGRMCKSQSLRFIVDAAQTTGVLKIDVEDAHIDALCFPGHKALLGPQGIGGLVIGQDFAAEVSPLIWGGTGSLSQDFEQPQFLPDKFESGTANIPGIMGLKAAIEYLNSTGVENIYHHEMELYQNFVSLARNIEGLRLVAAGNTNAASSASGDEPFSAGHKVAVVSVDFPSCDNAEIAALLDSDYGIMARCGLHCSPAAHKTLGTYPQGTLRFSFGHKNTLEEVDYLLDSLSKILHSLNAGNADATVSGAGSTAKAGI